MIVFLERTVLAAGGGVFGIPDIRRNFAEGMDAFGRKEEPFPDKLRRNDGNALSDRIFSGDNIGEAVVSEASDEGACGGVDNDRDVASAACKSEHIGGILTVVLLSGNAVLGASAVVEILAVNVMRDIVACTGGEEVEKNAWVERAVVNSDEIPFGRESGRKGACVRKPCRSSRS